MTVDHAVPTLSLCSLCGNLKGHEDASGSEQVIGLDELLGHMRYLCIGDYIMTYHAKIIAGGKVVIPADMRRALNVKDGDSIVFEREGDVFVVKSYRQVVHEVQAEFKRLVPNPGTVDEFLAERRNMWGDV
jgi:AbrB family transcriptional regulator, stage V sporulation protein T